MISIWAFSAAGLSVLHCSRDIVGKVSFILSAIVDVLYELNTAAIVVQVILFRAILIEAAPRKCLATQNRNLSLALARGDSGKGARQSKGGKR